MFKLVSKCVERYKQAVELDEKEFEKAREQVEVESVNFANILELLEKVKIELRDIMEEQNIVDENTVEVNRNKPNGET